jgi:hypothetical protein
MHCCVNLRSMRNGPPVDYGSRWIDPSMPDRYHRVAWDPGTGRLYATDAACSYSRTLATVRNQARLDAVLGGWADVAAGPDPPLSWIEERVAEPPG